MQLESPMNNIMVFARLSWIVLALSSFIASPSHAQEEVNVEIGQVAQADNSTEAYIRVYKSDCYRCPHNSNLKRQKGYKCTGSFYDCYCEQGYIKWGDYCRFCFYDCPAYSYPKHGLKCWENFGDCNCEKGYHKNGNKCVPYSKMPYPTPHPTPYPTKGPTESPTKDPTNSPTKNPTKSPTKDPTKSPATPFPTPYPTKKRCYYYCPANSKPRYGVECPHSFNDCECDYGYTKVDIFCIHDGKPPYHPNPYYGPNSSYPNPSYHPNPKRSSGSYPPPKYCYYNCPVNSHPVNSLGCASSFYDCECDYGFTKYKHYCKYHPKTTTPYPTKDPTMMPTNDPTLSPTKDPTLSPTKDPTLSPTKDPTLSPTKDPTLSPTTDPTMNPTKAPTTGPTTDPTMRPTKDPTMRPTKKKPCYYYCPENSKTKHGAQCPYNFDDCECAYGYKKKDTFCTKLSYQPYPYSGSSYYPNGYSDPYAKPNSYSKPYLNTNTGHYPNQNSNSRLTGINGGCFFCPEHSTPKNGMLCPSSAFDCECFYGYLMMNGACVLMGSKTSHHYYRDPYHNRNM